MLRCLSDAAHFGLAALQLINQAVRLLVIFVATIHLRVDSTNVIPQCLEPIDLLNLTPLCLLEK